MVEQALSTTSHASELLSRSIEGQIARFIDEYLSVSDPEFQGSVVVEAIEGKIAVIALELGSKAGEFATLPVSE